MRVTGIIGLALAVMVFQSFISLPILNVANSKRADSSVVVVNKQSYMVALRARLAADLGKQNYGFSLSFSPKGDILATGSDTRPAKLWDVTTGQLRSTLAAHRASSRVTFTSDGHKLATSGDKKVALWDTDTGEMKHALTGSSGLVFGFTYWIEFSLDNRLILASGSDSKARLYDVTSGELKTTFQCRRGWMFATFSPDGQVIATSCNQDNAAKLWNSGSGQLVGTLEGHRAGITRVFFSPDGNTVATESLDDTVRLWEAKTQQLRAVLSGHQSTIYDSEFSPNGRWLATASRDGTAKLWDVKTGRLRYTLTGFDGIALRVAFSANSRTLAASGGNKHYTAKLVDVDTEQLIATLEGHRNDIEQLVFDPHGVLLVTASKESVRVWNSVTGVLVASLDNARYPTKFSPDGETLATVSVDKNVLLWDVR